MIQHITEAHNQSGFEFAKLMCLQFAQLVIFSWWSNISHVRDTLN